MSAMALNSSAGYAPSLVPFLGLTRWAFAIHEIPGDRLQGGMLGREVEIHRYRS